MRESREFSREKAVPRETSGEGVPDARNLRAAFDIICDNVGKDWRKLARHLRVSDAKIEAIEEKYPRNLAEQATEAASVRERCPHRAEAGNRRTWAVWSPRHQAGLSFPSPHLLGDSLDTGNDFVSARVVSWDRPSVWGDDKVPEMAGMMVDNIVSEDGEFYVVYYFTTIFKIILHVKLTI
ncbi:FAS-associated death domain protein isoform X7 [Balaenoptera musculus]|uniref:FAS-associated death domain protein isoform X7 n=1 Tax=Balaenoptera musculus TaxID=9771 RepID=A0A8B8Y554_BALMU|nr:FAS-associated death domain protein isoform X7 [Balaenoptera musculus]